MVMGSIKNLCDDLKTKLNCEFVGFAIQNETGPDIRWHYAAGNLNEKYKRITVRYGKGIAGKVISTGSPMMIEHFPETIAGKAIEYPIMLAEKLISSYAVPIFHNGSPKGVLLVGRRSAYLFTENEQKMVQNAAKRMGDELNNM
jgi:nitrogen regulatory protein A